jgi:tetratricopeptide (TPR) repeat protein
LFSQVNIQYEKQSFEKAYEQHPYNIHVMNNLASCFENEKNHVKAEEFYSKALIISPAFEEARLNLSAVYYNTQQYEKAFETIDQCDINATDQKYQLFLPAILSSLVDHMAESNKEQAAQFLTIKNNKTELMQLYMTSKKENINFKNYITQHLTNTKP